MTGRKIVTQRTVVVIEVIQDHETDHEPPKWWEALDLPAPERWQETFNSPVSHARVLLERRVSP